MVALVSINAALHGIDEHTARAGGVKDLAGEVEVGSEGVLRGFVSYKLDGPEQAESADIANAGKLAECCERFAECGSGYAGLRACSGNEILRLDALEHSAAGGDGDGMRVVGEAVGKAAAAFGDGINDAGAGDKGAERRVSAGDALGSHDDVGSNAPVLHSEVLAGATEAGHDLIGDEQYLVLAASFGDARQIAFRRSGSTESGAAHRLEDEAGNVGGVLFEDALELKRILCGAVFALVGAAITVGRRDALVLTHHWQIDLAAAQISGDAYSAQGGAMIGVAAAEDLIARAFTDLDLILAGQLERGLDRFRSAASEVDASATEILSGEGEDLARECFSLIGDELAGVNELEARGLRRHGLADLGDAVADEVDGGAASEIKITLAGIVEDPGAFATRGDWKLLFERASEESGVLGHGGIIRDTQSAASLRGCAAPTWRVL